MTNDQRMTNDQIPMTKKPAEVRSAALHSAVPRICNRQAVKRPVPAAIELRKSLRVWSPGFSRPSVRVINPHDHFDAPSQCLVVPAEAGPPNLTTLNSMSVGPGPCSL